VEQEDKEWRSTTLTRATQCTQCWYEYKYRNGHRRSCRNGDPTPHSRPMQGYACEWPDCDKTYKKAADLERHERTREHDDE
jgi:hypothetical protein